MRADTDLVDVCRSVVDSWNATARRHDVVLDADIDRLVANVDAPTGFTRSWTISSGMP